MANSDEAYRFAEERFRVGTGTALELQEARNQLYESTSDMISSKYVLIFYTRILDFYMGKGDPVLGIYPRNLIFVTATSILSP